MASSSGTSDRTSSGVSYLVQSSGSEPDLQQLMDLRKEKRMLSNRESAQRSRKRKQKHLDDLVTQVNQLEKENNLLITDVNITTQSYMSVEMENRVLRAQAAELIRRLQSLNDIIDFMYLSVDNGCGFVEEQYVGAELVDEFMGNKLGCVCGNQPILASADMFMY